MNSLMSFLVSYAILGWRSSRRSSWALTQVLSFSSLLFETGNRRYVGCLYVYNKSKCEDLEPSSPIAEKRELQVVLTIFPSQSTFFLTVDSISMEQMDKIAREDHSMVISCELGLNLEGPGGLKDRIWVSRKLHLKWDFRSLSVSISICGETFWMALSVSLSLYLNRSVGRTLSE